MSFILQVVQSARHSALLEMSARFHLDGRITQALDCLNEIIQDNDRDPPVAALIRLGAILSDMGMHGVSVWSTQPV